MKFSVSENVDVGQWDAFVCVAGGSIFHSSTWAKYIVASRPNAVPRFATLQSDDGEPLGAALVFQQRSEKRLFAPLTGHLWLEAVPVVSSASGNLLLEFLRMLQAYARESGSIELTVGSFASARGHDELAQLGFGLTRRMEFELGLESAEEDLWNGVEYKRRKNIKKALRMGVVIRDLLGADGVQELRRLQAESSQRVVARGGPDIAHKKAGASDPAEVLLDSGLARVVGAELGGELVSAGLFTYFNGLVYHTLSGHGQKALETQAPTLLLWETIKRYREEGAKRLNFGGCSADAVNGDSPEHGVYEYKKAFGGQCMECASGHKILRKMAHSIASAVRTILRR